MGLTSPQDLIFYNKMKTYELAYIVSPEISMEEAEAKAKEIESAVQKNEGTILKQSNPTAKTLAYPVKKRASGFFGFLEFQLEPEKIIELKKIMEKDGKIVRHMFLIKEPAKPRRERRSRTSQPEITVDEKRTPVEIKIEESKPLSSVENLNPAVKEKEKVELKDIEQQLDEILGE